ncbi:hypothetical protein ASC77_19940 [Nocardioides sp. Root1257]|uniref:tyrosine-type recombinase/integrase n=1 Tax=unclassified Nocardioides TaxID=2615069 RepID=UPI0006F32352|nr:MULTISPECIES: tyrosine-type recombinase/integrase [unclassified Nocardioides]KQW45055.1 hypothetical protein ASC77_19940 [Nocardioides sp. Root1257]KRC45941.1 hypothetical protein ASE24_15280 [Nocardioides sp. Root224]
MGRPLSGRIKPTPTGFRADLPEATGSTRRIGGTFPDRDTAQAWLDDAIAAHQSGTPITHPRDWQTARHIDAAETAEARQQAPANQSMPGGDAEGGGGRGDAVSAVSQETDAPATFRAVASAYLRERYVLGHQAGGDREIAERDLLDKLDRAFFTARGLSPVTLTRDAYLSILCQWAGTETGPLNKRIPAHQVDNADFPRGYSAQGVRNHRQTLDKVLRYAWKVLGQPALFDPDTVETPKTDARKKAPKRAITLAETAAVAAHLHAVHQLTLWVLRLSGLRISECFGLHVADAAPVPDGSGRGLLVVARQGGRVFWERLPDGTLVARTEVDRVKTEQSVRLVPIPAALMRLIRLTIEIFHTDANGDVDPNTRLIPDLTGAGSGQGSFRAAFAKAAARAGLDVSSDLVDGCELPIPHDLRKTIGTDLAVAELPAWVRLRHLGHAAGTDVHHRHYLLDDPAAAPLLRVADALQATLDADLPAPVATRLVVPTLERCTAGNQSALARRADQIDAQLLEADWLITPTDAGTDLLDAAQVAAYLNMSAVTVRRWLRDGMLPSRPLPGGRADRRCAALADVEALRVALSDGTTMADLADELDYGAASLHQAAARLGLPLERRGRITLVPEQTRAGLTAWVARRRRLEADGYTHDQAAARLRVPVQTIRSLVRSGVLTALPTGTGERAYVTRPSVDQADLTGARSRRRRRSTARRDAA